MNPRTAAASADMSADAFGRARRVLRQFHLWIALVLSLPLIVVGLTGSILVFGSEVTEWLHPPPSLPVDTGKPHAVAEILAAAQAAVGHDYVSFSYQPPALPGQPATVRLVTLAEVAPRPRIVTVLIDPVSLRLVVDAKTGVPSFVGLLRRLHGNLLLGSAGRAYVGKLGIALLALVVTGLILWWPQRGRWRAAFVIKRGARGLRLHRDIHGAVGIWMLFVVTAVTLSGVDFVFPQAVGGMVRKVLPSHDSSPPAPIVRAEGARRIDADRAIAVALAASPGARPQAIWLPLWPDQPYRVSMAQAGADVEAPQMLAMVNPWSGDLMQFSDPARFAPAQKVLAWQRMIHFGRGLGWGWRIVVCLSGLLPAIFAYTGIAMWLIRRRTRRHAGRAA